MPHARRRARLFVYALLLGVSLGGLLVVYLRLIGPRAGLVWWAILVGIASLAAYPLLLRRLGRLEPLVVLSVMALALYLGVRQIEFSELGRRALFDVVTVCVALGISGFFGVVGAWLRSNGDEAEEGFCFVGAVIGVVVFYVALLT